MMMTETRPECACCAAPATHELPELAFDGRRRTFPTLMCAPHATEWGAEGHRTITLAQRARELAA